ncbi:hypothetical protein FH972_024604 [Carpinus fangiana]|uniref:homoserine dehydrogenase n=1 Tax=Carpinus fangiana TaxID=176857 RepID=A0A5N6KYW2_9ROSI|nr:hypothetical protein FH972_024604 [Carpinus fangiana]
MASAKIIYVAVIGVGGVGKSFLTQLEAILRQPASSTSVLSHLRLVYIARSKKALVSESYKAISQHTWPQDLARSNAAPLSQHDLVDYLSKAPGRAIVVDNTSNNDIAEAYPLFLAASISVVTPSKIAFSSDLDLWKAIFTAAANGSGPPGAGYVFHEPTVGAGLPVISTIKDLNNTGNHVTRVEGVFSGTMSFLFNSFMPMGGAESVPFSAHVKIAKDLGYTEPDARHDLSGLDVARKCTILARLCGLAIPSPTSFPVQSLIPAGLADCKSSNEFLERLADFDDDMEKVKTEALSEGKVLRYVGAVDVTRGECEVGLKRFDSEHPIAAMKGDDLQLNLYTAHYKSPIVIQGCGEGAYLAVLTDLIKVCELLL